MITAEREEDHVLVTCIGVGSCHAELTPLQARELAVRLLEAAKEVEEK